MNSIDRQALMSIDEHMRGCGIESNPGLVLEGPVVVATESLRVADSPRLTGEDPEHVRTLAGVDAKLPPIIVHRASMKIIDGMHRWRAAELRGDSHIEVSFFEGTESDAFVIAVRANVDHGLPLSKADRVAAAKRLIESHPEWSDRSLATFTGLSAKTISTMRRCTSTALPEPHGRMGRDGRVRPLDTTEGRNRAGRLIAEKPNASLREIASEAGISPATVRDVRARLERGADPVPDPINRMKRKTASAVDRGEDARMLLRTLQRDPSLRLTESGRVLLRLLSWPLTEVHVREHLVSSVPSHCADLVIRVARECATSWAEFADELAVRDQPCEKDIQLCP
ncbi:ParB/RepB/Spo0J family partition protein [Nocardia sp. NPDC059764]|uniref:ParB/RepB/Spo0J family partition protein n=1 Tax=Nocardia sp. NPDC059764 TaxID=3346939 RepID=UPI00366569FB